MIADSLVPCRLSCDGVTFALQALYIQSAGGVAEILSLHHQRFCGRAEAIPVNTGEFLDVCSGELTLGTLEPRSPPTDRSRAQTHKGEGADVQAESRVPSCSQSMCG